MPSLRIVKTADMGADVGHRCILLACLSTPAVSLCVSIAYPAICLLCFAAFSSFSGLPCTRGAQVVQALAQHWWYLWLCAGWAWVVCWVGCGHVPGGLGLWRSLAQAGVETNIIRSVPYCVVTFVSFESIHRLVKGHLEDDLGAALS
jgi:hypothetical protein